MGSETHSPFRIHFAADSEQECHSNLNVRDNIPETVLDSLGAVKIRHKIISCGEIAFEWLPYALTTLMLPMHCPDSCIPSS
jgi:hypothetical protein